MISKMLLIGSLADSIGDVFKKLLNYIILTIDSIVFWFVKLINQVFFLVVDTNMEGEAITTKMNELMDRIYVILGVGMLFFVAYKIICLMTDPDKFGNDGNDSMQGIAKNVVISVIMLSLIPTVFNYLMRFQTRVVSTNVIGSIILGTGTDEDAGNDVKKAGAKAALAIYSSFYYPVSDTGKIYTYYDCGGGGGELAADAPDICSVYVQKYDAAMDSENVKDFILDEELNQALVDGQMEHIAIIPVLAGAYAVWLYLVFTLDIATRAIKLLFYRLIAPIPVMMRITKPVGGAFTKWTNDVIKTYISLFIRLMIINFSLFTINLIVSLNLNELFPSSDSSTGLAVLLAKVAVLLGILQFAKDAPKMVEELFGIEHIDTSVAGMKNRLNENEYAKRAAVAGGALGLGGARAGWNAIQGRFNKKSNQYAARQKRKEERNAYKERRRQYREGLSGAGRVADSVAHGASTVFGAVGAAGRTAARTLGTAGRGLAAGNVDFSDIGNAIVDQDMKNQQRYADQDQKRAQRIQRATQSRFNTGSYFFPSVQGAIGNIIDGIPEVTVGAGNVVSEGQQTQKDVGAWLTKMVDNALRTSSMAAVSADRAAITEAKDALSRLTDLKFMNGNDAELDAEKASRESAIINNSQRDSHEATVSYKEKTNQIDSETSAKKEIIENRTVTSVTESINRQVSNEYARIDADASITDKDAAKQRVRAAADAKIQAETRPTTANLTTTIAENRDAKIANIQSDPKLTAAEKTAKIQEVKTTADSQIASLNTAGAKDTLSEIIARKRDSEITSIQANTNLSDSEKQTKINQVKTTAQTKIDGLTEESAAFEIQTDLLKDQVDNEATAKKNKLKSAHLQTVLNISETETESLKQVKADIKKKKIAAKVQKMQENSATMAVAFNVETENKIMTSINKMSSESQSAIYSPKMAEILGLTAADATPENIQTELRKTFSDIRAGGNNITEKTVLAIEQLKKSLGSALSISELATVNSGKKDKGGDKK